MTYLFIFSHPDDESVACGGTIKQLVDAGERVIVVSVTDGGAGEVIESAKELYGAMATPAIRKLEFENAMYHLGVTEFEIMGIPDGSITNQTVWGELKDKIITLFNRYKPDVVITFDHTGWYYHLDHIGTSIATTLAFHDAQTQAKALLYSHFRPEEEHDVWNYKYSEQMPITHKVRVTDIEHKLAACEMHKSQDLEIVAEYLHNQQGEFEYYEWGFGETEVKKLIESTLFSRVID